MKSGFFKFSVRDIVEIAVMCALAVVLDKFVKIPIGSTGGSINISAVPLFLIAFRHGWFKGFIASGIVFGLITCILDGYGFQYFPLEYLLAFGSIALGGLFGKMIFKYFTKKSVTGGIINKIMLVLVLIVSVAVAYLMVRVLFDYLATKTEIGDVLSKIIAIIVGGVFGLMIFEYFYKKTYIERIISIALVIASVGIFFVIRTFGATIDSMIFYEYPFGAALTYNLSYIGPTCLVVGAILCLLLPTIKNLNRLYPTEYLKDVVLDEEENEEAKENQ